MRIYWLLAVAITCSSLAVSGVDDREKAKATPVIIHQRIEGGCELVERGQLVQYHDYSAILIDGVSDEVYSPELAESDFIQPADAGGKLPKSASKTGFVVRAPDAAKDSPDLPRVVPVVTSNLCPSPQEAAMLAAKQREARRWTVQDKLYRVGSDDITRPEPESSPQPKSDGITDAADDEKPKVTRGTVILAAVVGPDGEVKDTKVLQSLDPVMDKLAVQQVRKWRYHPARKQGLPVAALIRVEVNWNLH